jgi:CRP/FNR family transcriptional regulator
MTIVPSQNMQNKDKSNFVECNDCSINSVCKLLETVKKVTNLSESYLHKRVATKANNVHFNQSTPLINIYGVIFGIFRLSQQTDDCTENIIGLRFPGEIIGKVALFLKSYNYIAIAISDS